MVTLQTESGRNNYSSLINRGNAPIVTTPPHKIPEREACEGPPFHVSLPKCASVIFRNTSGDYPSDLIISSSLFKVRINCRRLPLYAVWNRFKLASSRNFTIAGFTLPVAMVHSTMQNIAAQAPGIAPNVGGSQAFVQRIIMQAVFDVLEQQGRGAGLSDAIISIILGQLTIQTIYTPLECPNVFVNPMPMAMNAIMMNQVYCIIIGNTVTAICSTTMAGQQNCVTGAGTNVMPIPPAALTIGGTITTTNLIMANWSREMWQSVVDRVVRNLASGPFGSNFVTASGVVS